MRNVLAILSVLLMFVPNIGRTQRLSNPALPIAIDLDKLTVGSWADYAVSAGQSNSKILWSVVGRTRAGVVLQITMQGGPAKFPNFPITARMVLAADSAGHAVPMKHVVVQTREGDSVTMLLEALPLHGRFARTDPKTLVGEERIAIGKTSFVTRHYRDALRQGTLDVWLSEAVPPLGLVRMSLTPKVDSTRREPVPGRITVELVGLGRDSTLPPRATPAAGPSVGDLSLLPRHRSRATESMLRPPHRVDRPVAQLPPGQWHWDFEDGTLQEFQPERVEASEARSAVHNQPTFGDNVSSARALNTAGLRLPPNPCAGLVLDEATGCESGSGAIFYYLSALRGYLDRLSNDLRSIGGSYWGMAGFPIGKQGLYWIGTYENRPSRRVRHPTGRPSWGEAQGDGPTGRLISPTVELQQSFFHLLVGGGCSDEVGVYLQGRRLVGLEPRVEIPGRPEIDRPGVTAVWETLRDAAGRPIVARGYCIENMVRVSFDIRHLRGTWARILIEDRASGPWGHINVDDIWLSHRPPRPSHRTTDPVWGVADLHAHLMNEKSFTAYGGDGRTPDSRALWGSALGPIENLRNDNDTHTTNDFNYSSHQDEVFGSTYTLCRDVCLNMLEGAGLPAFDGDQVDQTSLPFDPLETGYHNTDGGYPGFVHWPMWYSAIHQQMHWSWVRRAYQGGLRLMIAAVGNSEVIAFGLAKERDRTFTSDQDALALQIPAIKEFARQNADWATVAYTPAQARRIMNEGRLAIIIGVELDHVMDNCSANVLAEAHHRATDVGHPVSWADRTPEATLVDIGVAGAAIGQLMGAGTTVMHYAGHPRDGGCSASQIAARVDALYREGVRHVIPMHFSDNLLGGYAITGDLFTASAIFGSPGARPPSLMGQAELVERYGTSAASFVEESVEVYPGENLDRKAEWASRLPIGFKLTGFTLPIWAHLGASAIMDANVIPPGPGRTIIEHFTGQCVEDDGWRAVLAVFTLGASEAACGLSSLTNEILDVSQSTMPYEGALDSPAMLPVGLAEFQRDSLPFHVNARGLMSEGAVFLREMMSRGMLIDIQHASDKAKEQILELTGAYPSMASHGGVQGEGPRASENVLSTSQLRRVYSPPGGWVGGLVGVGTQSSHAVVEQLRLTSTGAASGEEDRERHAVALGTDINGMDWHVGPRFGRFAFYHADANPPRKRAELLAENVIGDMVAYAPYAAGSNPWASTLPTCEPACPTWTSRRSPLTPLSAHQVTQSGVVTRSFDINFDGFAHYGMIPDFLQELAVLGATDQDMGALFRSSEALIQMWEESCYLAHQAPVPSTSIVQGCGTRDNYE